MGIVCDGVPCDWLIVNTCKQTMNVQTHAETKIQQLADNYHVTLHGALILNVLVMRIFCIWASEIFFNIVRADQVSFVTYYVIPDVTRSML